MGGNGVHQVTLYWEVVAVFGPVGRLCLRGGIFLLAMVARSMAEQINPILDILRTTFLAYYSFPRTECITSVSE